MKREFNISQTLYIAFFVATVVTVLNSLIEWEHKIYLGILAGITTIIGAGLAKLIFKGDN